VRICVYNTARLLRHFSLDNYSKVYLQCMFIYMAAVEISSFFSKKKLDVLRIRYR
jgi:hypothetical protein